MATAGVLGLVVAACGNGDSPEASPATDAPPTTEEPTSETTAADSGADETDETVPTMAPAPEPGPVPQIVATTTIWADVTEQVVCGTLADVATVIPAGADAHQYEPSLRDRELMGSAALLVTNGLLLEEGLQPTLDAVAADGVPVFAIAESMNDILDFDDDHAHDDDHDHAHDEDAHVWFDPVRVAAALPMLGDAVVSATGLDSGAVAECVARYQEELLALDAEMASILESVDDDDRKLVTSHESLGYFADRYSFDIIGTVLRGASSLAETNPADLEELANAIIASGVPAIFAEAEASFADIEALGSRAGVEVVPLLTESLGEPGSGADSYLGFLRTTATTVADALAR